MSVSLDSCILWKIDLGVAYAFSKDLVSKYNGSDVAYFCKLPIINSRKKKYFNLEALFIHLLVRFVDRWKTIARNVESVAVNENSAWYVSEGNVFVQFDLSDEIPCNEKSNKVPCSEKISKIYCYGNVSI